MLVSDVIIAWNPNQKWSELLTSIFETRNPALLLRREPLEEASELPAQGLPSVEIDQANLQV
jgi:hypothetical protein